MEFNPIIIGIAGGTGSGKSTLAENIEKEFKHNITMISHDYYYKSNEQLPFEERTKLNYTLYFFNNHIQCYLVISAFWNNYICIFFAWFYKLFMHRFYSRTILFNNRF